jgi:hypothetical protein
MDVELSFPGLSSNKNTKARTLNSDSSNENQKKRKRKRDLMPVPRTLQLSEEHKFAPINTPKHQLPILIVKCG